MDNRVFTFVENSLFLYSAPVALRRGTMIKQGLISSVLLTAGILSIAVFLFSASAPNAVEASEVEPYRLSDVFNDPNDGYAMWRSVPKCSTPDEVMASLIFAAQDQCPGTVFGTGRSTAGSCAAACLGAGTRANVAGARLCPRGCRLGPGVITFRDCPMVGILKYRCSITKSFPCD